MVRTVVGYSGGMEENPSYESIKDASETVFMEYDPSIVSYQDILDHWSTKFAYYRYPPHSKQYRHILFYVSSKQQASALAMIARLEETSPVYVTVEPLGVFYRAEEHHQDFFLKGRKKVEEANRMNLIMGKW